VLAFAAAIGVVNFVLLKSPPVAAFDLATFLLAAVLLPWERRTENLRAASWAAIVGLAVIILGYIITTDAADYAVLWLTVPPPLAFYLLGSRAGGWLSGVFSAAAVLWLAVSYRHLSAAPPSLLAVLNGLEVLLAHWLLFRFSERNREQAYERLRLLSRVDALTGVCNRATFEQELRGALALAQRSATPTALLFLDLDHFKKINDTHGHAAGDAVLVSVASALEERVRASDRVGRWGGEEFLVLCPDTGERGAGALAETLRRAIAALPQAGGFRVSVSIGVAVSPPGVEPADSLVSRADAALYRAKAAGRDRVAMAPPPNPAPARRSQ
jgi:diguanylate cyclase (GGDEF)-like protein